eukprot:CAMPEP_0206443918 /NCGR_PEP_ID=MMETSP0324_2-20121206/14632_1 /ASSEMBLY_ACC=CAM_ASM_000836 /TAXON_ID=2866 /ORGANISM="Crypthecodinium cohnii, Strain Seligo" /LENGTH=397 /DNA_ID=CAMNT_0053911901 /DNA_START=60 /DNA_END=1254 /DNA_ORIENTATION=+
MQNRPGSGTSTRSRRDEVWEMKRQRWLAKQKGYPGSQSGQSGSMARGRPPALQEFSGGTSGNREASPLSRFVAEGYPNRQQQAYAKGAGGPDKGGSGFDAAVAGQWSANVVHDVAARQNRHDPNVAGPARPNGGQRITQASGGNASIDLSWNSGQQSNPAQQYQQHHPLQAPYGNNYQQQQQQQQQQSYQQQQHQQYQQQYYQQQQQQQQQQQHQSYQQQQQQQYQPPYHPGAGPAGGCPPRMPSGGSIGGNQMAAGSSSGMRAAGGGPPPLGAPAAPNATACERPQATREGAAALGAATRTSAEAGAAGAAWEAGAIRHHDHRPSATTETAGWQQLGRPLFVPLLEAVGHLHLLPSPIAPMRSAQAAGAPETVFDTRLAELLKWFSDDVVLGVLGG